MPPPLKYALLAFLVYGSFLAPGLWLTKRSRTAPLERLTLAIGLSGTVLYLLSFGVYAFALPVAFLFLLLGAVSLSLAFCVRDFVQLAADDSVRAALGAFVFLTVWTAWHVLIIRSFAGGGWFGDWFEHFQRTAFFRFRVPLDSLLLGRYWLPARPPMMNVLTSYFLSFAPVEFSFFQTSCVAMATLVVFPLVLFCEHSTYPRARFVALLVFLIALNPLFMENATYPWTRNLANFYILSGLYFYWRGFLATDATKIGIALVFLASALLTHYSAGPYVVGIVGHLSLRFGILRFLRDRSFVALGAFAILILATWFGWSLVHYGWAITAGSNTTVLGAQGHSLTDFGEKLALNFWNTVIPHWLRHVDGKWIEQDLFWGRVRDSAFLVFQTNLIAAVGVTAGLLLLFQFGSEFHRDRHRDPVWRFWAEIVTAVIVLSIGVSGQPDDFGAAHVCLQPLVLLALVRLSEIAWEHGAMWRCVLGLGVFVGYALGIALHFGLQSIDDPGTVARLSIGARSNWQLKQDLHVVFLGDLAAGYANVLRGVEIVAAALLFVAFARYCVANGYHAIHRRRNAHTYQ
jgi:hypothetical protein